MAKFVLSHGGVKMAPTQTSQTWQEIVCKSVTLDVSVDAPDVTDFGQLTRHHLAGLKTWTGSVEVNQDWATGAEGEDLWAMVGANGSIRITPDTQATTKVVYSGNIVVTGYTPITGAVGDGASASVTFQGSETLALGSTW